jgi:hypothetical protein
MPFLWPFGHYLLVNIMFDWFIVIFLVQFLGSGLHKNSRSFLCVFTTYTLR